MNRWLSALLLIGISAGPCGAQAIDRPGTLEALTDQIETATAKHRWTDAILLGQKALAIEEATKGQNDPEVGGTLMLIAGWMRELDRNAEAEPLLRRSLQIFEQNYGKSNTFTISASNNLAATLESLGRLDDANRLRAHAGHDGATLWPVSPADGNQHQQPRVQPCPAGSLSGRAATL